MTKRSPITFTAEHLKEIFRDYCIQSSGEIPTDVAAIYVCVEAEDHPIQFDTIVVEFKDEDDS